MMKLPSKINILSKNILFIVAIVFFLFPIKTLALTEGQRNTLNDALNGNVGAQWKIDKFGGSVSSSDTEGKDTVLKAALATNTPLPRGQAWAQKKVDAVINSNGPESKADAAMRQQFSDSALGGNSWAQQKVLDSIQKGEATSAEIEKIKNDAAKNPKLKDFLDQIKAAEKAKNPGANPNQPSDAKPNTDNCVIVTPGMSMKVGKLYGEKEVAAFNDKRLYKEDYPILTKGKIIKYEDIKDVSELANYATDWKGDPATRKAGVEDKLNYDIRVLQQNEPDKFSVTTDDDIKAIKATGAESQIRQGKDASGKDLKCKGLSNETCDKEPTKGHLREPVRIPDRPQHEEYWIKNKKFFKIDDKNMFPGSDYIAGNKATSADAKLAAGTAGKEAGTMDAQVTENCEFKNNTEEPPKKPGDASGNPWQQPGNGNTPGGNNPGNPGSPGGDQGGLLGKILPALMQALQGLGQGGGQQPQQSGGQQGSGQPQPGGKQDGQENPWDNKYSRPSPTPSSFACPTTSDYVCGTDNRTYVNSCYANYQGQVSVKHAGACANNETGNGNTVCSDVYQPVCGSDQKTYPNTCELERESRLRSIRATAYLPPLTVTKQGACEDSAAGVNLTSLSALIEQATQSGIPSSVLESAIRIVTNLITSMLSGVTNTTGTTP